MRNLLILISTTLLFSTTACKFSKVKADKAKGLSSALVGQWQNTYLKVKSNSGAEDEMVVEVTEENWTDILPIEPILTTFKKDGTYTSEYKFVHREGGMTVEGKWYFEEDILHMEQISPQEANYSFKTIIEGKKVTFDGMLDWDNDGSSDDHYFGTQKKLN